MILALISVVWVGLFFGLGLSHIYAPATKKAKPTNFFIIPASPL